MLSSRRRKRKGRDAVALAAASERGIVAVAKAATQRPSKQPRRCDASADSASGVEATSSGCGSGSGSGGGGAGSGTNGVQSSAQAVPAWFASASASAAQSARTAAGVRHTDAAEPPAQPPESPSFLAALEASLEADTLVVLRMLRRDFPQIVPVERRGLLGATRVFTRVAPFPVMLETQVRSLISDPTVLSRELDHLIKVSKAIRVLQLGTSARDMGYAFTTDVVEWLHHRAARCDATARAQEDLANKEAAQASFGAGSGVPDSPTHRREVRERLRRGAASGGSAMREPIFVASASGSDASSQGTRSASNGALHGDGIGSVVPPASHRKQAMDAQEEAAALRAFVDFLPKCTDPQVTERTLKDHLHGYKPSWMTILVRHGLLTRSVSNAHVSSYWFSVPSVRVICVHGVVKARSW